MLYYLLVYIYYVGLATYYYFNWEFSFSQVLVLLVSFRPLSFFPRLSFYSVPLYR